MKWLTVVSSAVLTEFALRPSPPRRTCALLGHLVTPTTVVAVTYLYTVLTESSQGTGLTAAKTRESR